MSTPHYLHLAIRDLSKAIKDLERYAQRDLEDAARAEKNLVWDHNMWASGVFAAQLVRDGIAPNLAHQRAAARYGVPVETAAHYAKRMGQVTDAAARDQRARDVIRRARLGETNAQIAAAWGISPRTVTRIVSEYRQNAARTPL